MLAEKPISLAQHVIHHLRERPKDASSATLVNQLKKGTLSFFAPSERRGERRPRHSTRFRSYNHWRDGDSEAAPQQQPRHRRSRSSAVKPLAFSSTRNCAKLKKKNALVAVTLQSKSQDHKVENCSSSPTVIFSALFCTCAFKDIIYSFHTFCECTHRETM